MFNYTTQDYRQSMAVKMSDTHSLITQHFTSISEDKITNC